jgi:DNA (cytosine-5)-methyltransferase 1
MIASADRDSAPEQFRYDKDREVIERIVARRDGTKAKTEMKVAKRPAARNDDDDLAARFDQQFLRSAAWPAVPRCKSQVRVVDLFSGCGIMTLGIWEACRALQMEMVPVLAVDTNRSALSTYRLNFPTAMIRSTDIATILDGSAGERITASERVFAKEVTDIDIVVGGPPCQGHSDLNNHTRRRDPKNALYEKMSRVAEVIGPTTIIIENVSTALHDKERVVDKTAERLGRLGYSIDEIVADAVSLGVPQARRRHAIVASLGFVPDLAKALTRYRRPKRPISWAIADLMHVKGNGAFDLSSKPTATNQSRMDFLFEHDRFDLPDDQRPVCHRDGAHTYKSVYGRLKWFEPAQTITTGFGCTGQGRYVHPKERRTLTPHEAARLQFIPDFFSFDSSAKRTAIAQMIGNAVPTKITYLLGLELLR